MTDGLRALYLCFEYVLKTQQESIIPVLEVYMNETCVIDIADETTACICVKRSTGDEVGHNLRQSPATLEQEYLRLGE